MPIALAVFLVLAGIALLGGGGELLVRGATSLARLARVTPAVIGLTIVAMGTSLPELVVSLVAGLGGQPDVAMGNVVGSNIFNVGVIVGVAALLLPLAVHGNAVRLEWPFMFVASCIAQCCSPATAWCKKISPPRSRVSNRVTLRGGK